jgi:hypothetical protein
MGRGYKARGTKPTIFPQKDRSPALPEESIDRPVAFKHFFRPALWRRGDESGGGRRAIWYDPPNALPGAGTRALAEGETGEGSQ